MGLRLASLGHLPVFSLQQKDNHPAQTLSVTSCQKLLSDQYKKSSAPRFASEENLSAATPVTISDRNWQQLSQLFPQKTRSAFQKAVGLYRSRLENIVLEVGKPITLNLAATATSRQKQEKINQGKTLTPEDLLRVYDGFENNFLGTGEHSRKIMQALRQKIDLVNINEILEQRESRKLEENTLTSQEFSDLVSVFPNGLKTTLENALPDETRPYLQFIRVEYGRPIALKLLNQPKERILNTPPVQPDTLTLINTGLYRLQLEASADLTNKQALKSLERIKSKLNVVQDDAVPPATHVGTGIKAEPKVLNRQDFQTLISLFPSHLQQELRQVPMSQQDDIREVRVQVKKPLALRHKDTLTEYGKTPVTLEDMAIIEASLQRGLNGNGAKAKSFSRISRVLTLDRTFVPEVKPPRKSHGLRNQINQWNATDFPKLLEVLPASLQRKIQAIEAEAPGKIEEIFLELGYPPVLLMQGKRVQMNDKHAMTLDDLNHIKSRMGPVGSKNRAGIEGTLHRISPMFNPKREVTGFTIRVGRVIDDDIEPLRADLERGQSLLIASPPGYGKTTKLRKIIRHMSTLEEIGGRPPNGCVMVVDTSNEIGGDGNVRHPFLGLARRMQVPSRDKQHEVMLEAVENHRPRVLAIDEIGTQEEARAAADIGKKGVMLIATVHADSFEELIENKKLTDLFGNPTKVTVGDDTVSQKGLKSKTQTERSAPPPFKSFLLMKDRSWGEYYANFTEAIDQYFKTGKLPKAMIVTFNSGK